MIPVGFQQRQFSICFPVYYETLQPSSVRCFDNQDNGLSPQGPLRPIEETDCREQPTVTPIFFHQDSQQDEGCHG